MQVIAYEMGFNCKKKNRILFNKMADFAKINVEYRSKVR